jgi:Holliday junction resolvase RusA-like endonuclease
MVKSRGYRDYERKVFHWLTGNQDQVRGVREFLKDLGDYVLDVGATFHMGKTQIVCLNGKPKRNDTSNRLKALHDALSTAILGIDDSYIWSCSADKKAVEDGSFEMVEIKIKLRKIKEDERV